MPRIFFVFLLLCLPALAERPSGFLGIQWGASPEEAKRVMQARPGVKFPDDADDYKFELTGGTFAGQPVAKWTLEFPERKFANAAVVIKTTDPQSLYKDFRAQLVAKYGSATTSQKITSKAPRAAGAPRTSSLATSSSWKFRPNMKDKSSVVISCELSGPDGGPTNDPAQLQLVIRYQNETLISAAVVNTEVSEKPVQVGVKKEEL